MLTCFRTSPTGRGTLNELSWRPIICLRTYPGCADEKLVSEPALPPLFGKPSFGLFEYASEIWAGSIPAGIVDDAERIQTNFARSILGLVGSQSIPNDLIRSEMGMEKLSCRWEKLRLGYWRRINLASPERTLAAVVSLRRKQLAWDYPGSKHGWMSGTRDLLVDRGLIRFWSDPNLCHRLSKKEWKQIVYDAVERAEDIARRNR